MPEDTLYLLGQIRGELTALRHEHDQHAALAKEKFDELAEIVTEIKAAHTVNQANAHYRKSLGELARWAVMAVIAAVAGHTAGGH